MATSLRPLNKMICDYSRILVAAISREFFKGRNAISCIHNILIGHEKKVPDTCIRLDVVHMINVFCSFKCLSDVKNNYLKKFYIRSLCLLMTSEDLSTFEYTLDNLMIGILSETDK